MNGGGGGGKRIAAPKLGRRATIWRGGGAIPGARPTAAAIFLEIDLVVRGRESFEIFII